jgi:hypothetical protein
VHVRFGRFLPALAALVAACGARTPLDGPSMADAGAVDSTAPEPGDSSGGSADVGTATDSFVADDGGDAFEGGACESLSTLCGSASCSGSQLSPVCCAADTTQAPGFSCSGCNCGCETQLDCTAAGQGCSGFGDMCCFKEQPCGDGGTHWVASCQLLSNCGPVLCDPGATGGNGICPDAPCTADTASVGIPPNSGYGVCMWSRGP